MANRGSGGGAVWLCNCNEVADSEWGCIGNIEFARSERGVICDIEMYEVREAVKDVASD